MKAVSSVFQGHFHIDSLFKARNFQSKLNKSQFSPFYNYALSSKGIGRGRKCSIHRVQKKATLMTNLKLN